MSWSGYVDNLEKGKGQCKYAAILGKNETSSPWAVWAESADKSSLPATPQELIHAATTVMNKDSNVQGNGLKIGGIPFACIIFDQESDILICQGKREYKDYSLVIATGAKTCLVGFNPNAEVKTPQVREAVESVRDYLKNAGY